MLTHIQYSQKSDYLLKGDPVYIELFEISTHLIPN